MLVRVQPSSFLLTQPQAAYFSIFSLLAQTSIRVMKLLYKLANQRVKPKKGDSPFLIVGTPSIIITFLKLNFINYYGLILYYNFRYIFI
jgi:hypothetical protein